MGDENKTRNGEFCWNELMTPDAKKAKSFYTALFGWESDDKQITKDITYAMFKSGDKYVGGGMMEIPEDQRKQIPPHWMSYVNVDNLEATVKKATSLGATVNVPISPAGEAGRFAIITDPTGAHVGLWESAVTSD